MKTLEAAAAELETRGVVIRASIGSPSKVSTCARPIGGSSDWVRVEKAELVCADRRLRGGVDIDIGSDPTQVNLSTMRRSWSVAAVMPEIAFTEQHVAALEAFGSASAIARGEHVLIDGQRFDLPVNNARRWSFAFYRASTDAVLSLTIGYAGIASDLVQGIAQDYP